MESEYAVPEDLRELYADCLADVRHSSRRTTSEFMETLIERIATLAGERDRQYEFNAGAIAKIAALEAQVADLKERAQYADSLYQNNAHRLSIENDHLKEKVAALSKPVSDSEIERFRSSYFANGGSWEGNTRRILVRFLEMRLQPAPEKAK
jgi:hypothetical protein